MRVLEPFNGYFVWNASADAETIFVPPVEAVLDTVAPLALTARAAGTPGAAVAPGAATAPGAADTRAAGFWLDVTARTTKAQDAANRAGVDARASDGPDAFDRREPPPPPGAWVRARFAAPASDPGQAAALNAAPRLLRTDFRAAGEAGYAWSINLDSSTRAEAIDVDVRQHGALPGGFELWLLDLDTGSTARLDPGASEWPDAMRVLSQGPDRACHVRLLAGTPAWVAAARTESIALPGRVMLDQNAPNPFNATTRVRFGLPQASRARLEIFDVRGRRVVVLADEILPAGWHTRFWTGRDASGHAVASGLYFCRLRAGSTSLTRRLVLVE